MSDMTIGFAITGSFCTFKAVFPQMNLLVEHGYHVLPIMSENVYTTDTRFGRAADWVAQAEEVCGEKVIHTIAQAEPIGPKKLLDLLILAPCTGNTLGKLACGIYDTAPTLAVKSHRRNGRPVLIAVSTNDALAGAAAGIGLLMNRKGTYFVPFQQDDFRAKPTSCVADFTQILPAAEAALEGGSWSRWSFEGEFEVLEFPAFFGLRYNPIGKKRKRQFVSLQSDFFSCTIEGKR